MAAPIRRCPRSARDVPVACANCSRGIIGRTAFTLAGEPRCLRCALRYRPLLRRSALTSLVVGTLLVSINQGAALLAGHAAMSLFWQIPLTYAVPFCVATWGALSNSKVRLATER